MEHFQFINRLADWCEAGNLTIFEHNYNHIVFGSWSLVIGNTKHRMKFNWDGKESYLGISSSSFQNQNSVPAWKPIFPGIGGTSVSQESVFKFIQEILAKQYAI